MQSYIDLVVLLRLTPSLSSIARHNEDATPLLSTLKISLLSV